MEDVRIGDGRGVYVAPSGDGPHAGVVVLHEATGLNDDTRRIARHVAGLGYATVAPDLFSFGSKLRCIARAVQEGFLAPQGTVTTGHVEQARAWLADRPEVDGTRIGIVGFCMGGGFAVVAAARHPFAAAAVNYGRVPKDTSLLDGSCPVVANYGAADRTIPASMPRRLEQTLADQGVPVDVEVFPGVGHSFMNHEPALVQKLGFAHDERAAAQAWTRIQRFFATHLDVPAG